MFNMVIHYTLIPLLLRLFLAAVFVLHGLAKVDPDKDWGAHWHPGPEAPVVPVQLLVAWGELLGGIALGAGFLTRAAAVGIILIMAGAIATVHAANGFIGPGGYEYNVALIVMCACLVIGGPGPIAVDRYFRLKRERND